MNNAINAPSESTNNEEETSREALRQRLLADKLLDKFDSTFAILEYDGYGDSGGPQDCIPNDNELIDFLWEFVEKFHSGFWNDEGGRGTVTWDLLKDIITVDHNDIIMDTVNTITVIGPDGETV